jgi:hypothetical protein
MSGPALRAQREAPIEENEREGSEEAGETYGMGPEEVRNVGDEPHTNYSFRKGGTTVWTNTTIR